MSFFDEVQNEWETEVQPILDDVYEGITHIIEGRDGPDIFKRCGTIDLYTRIYKMTISHQFDFFHLDFLFKKEIEAVVSFCKRFRARTLEEMNRHVQGFDLLIRWFYCFFHHLNRLREKTYPHASSVEEDMILSVRDHYFRTQKGIISQLVCDHWSFIRGNQYPTDHVLLRSIKSIFRFDPTHHHYLLLLYYEDLQKFSNHQADLWLSGKDPLFYMDMADQFFLQEKQMFLYYFYQYHDSLSCVYNIMKKALIYPHLETFMHDNQYGWKALLHSNHLHGIRISYHFYSWSDDHTPWLLSYQDFLEEKIRSSPIETLIMDLDRLRKGQSRVMGDIFLDERIRGRFTDVLEKILHKTLSRDNQVVYQLVKTIHQNIPKRSSGGILEDMMELVGYCDEKDLFYEYYHQFMKSRLLSGRSHLPHEKRLIGFLKDRFGVSFVLNLDLMLDEVQKECLSYGPYHMFRLSGVVWGVGKRLAYKPPSFIEDKLQILYDQWRQKTNPMLRLELMWSQGAVVFSMGSSAEFTMTPVQAIVLMNLEEPHTRQGLVDVLGVPDDDDHNLDGVLESLSKPGLIRECDGEWHWVLSHKPGRVVLPHVRNKQQQLKKDNISHVIVEAFIVRTLKRENSMTIPALMGCLSKQYPHIQMTLARKLVDGLIHREFLSKDDDQMLSYVP